LRNSLGEIDALHSGEEARKKEMKIAGKRPIKPSSSRKPSDLKKEGEGIQKKGKILKPLIYHPQQEPVGGLKSRL